jgi:RNA polymerase sigma factor (sigma-70 family)
VNPFPSIAASFLSMTDAADPVDRLALLENRAWVRSIARRLLADENDVDDAEQQTWTTALRAAPAEPRALRSWLGVIASRAALQTLRSRTRRARRERAATRDETVRSAADVLAEADAHGHVVQAVLALPEPYRATVLLRYFESLPIADVARRMEVPVETVRTRLKRAHERLRARLDADTGGDGRRLVLALVPLTTRGFPESISATFAGGVMSSATKTIAAAVLGLLAGVFGALAWTGAADRNASDGPQELGGTGPSVASAGDARRQERRLSSAAQEAGITPTSRSAVSAALDEVILDAPPEGHGSIGGRVLTQDAKPLGGVLISAFRPRIESRYRRGRAQPSLTAEQTVRDAILDAKWRAAITRETTTDDQGCYRLVGLADAPYWLRASEEGFEIRIAAHVRNPSDIRPGATVDFVATHITFVPLNVLMPDGTSAERADVRWSDPRKGGGVVTWFRDDPIVAIDDGGWSLTAESGTEFRSEPVTVDVGPERDGSPVTLQLRARNVIEGAVRWDAADAGWDYVWLTLRRQGRTENEPRSYGSRPPDWGFRIEDVEPGDYDLTAALHQTSPLVTATIHVEGGKVLQDLAIPRLDASQHIEIQVTGPDGKPISAEALNLSIEGRWRENRVGLGLRPVRRADGVFLVALPAIVEDMAGNVVGGGAVNSPVIVGPSRRWFVVDRSNPNGTREVEFVRGTTTRVELRFD